jgi:hypothetical protein
MNTDKATKLLKKIQALYDNLGDQGSMSSLERDLILSYLRELYEEFSTATRDRAKRFEGHRRHHRLLYQLTISKSRL